MVILVSHEDSRNEGHGIQEAWVNGADLEWTKINIRCLTHKVFSLISYQMIGFEAKVKLIGTPALGQNIPLSQIR